MKSFIKKLAAFLSIIVLGMMLTFYILDAKGWSDGNYKRFTSKGECSLIIGTSKAAQGIVPEVVDSCLTGREFRLPIYNFAFNIGESPFGEVYYKSINNKLGNNPDGNSLFIVAVDPYSLSFEASDRGIPESRRTLGHIRHFHKPNLEYMFRYCRPKEWRPSTNQQLHDDGWLELSVQMDSASVAQRVKWKMDDYNSYHITPSDYRMHWLGETVTLLKNNGTVFLCRIPVGTEISEWEENMWPTFDDDMYELAKLWNVAYFPFAEMRNSYRTTDGNHLYKEDGRKFTRDLCDSINMCSLVVNDQVY